jgi:hypothetical protein
VSNYNQLKTDCCLLLLDLVLFKKAVINKNLVSRLVSRTTNSQPESAKREKL